jgi:hypothetical protein
MVFFEYQTKNYDPVLNYRHSEVIYWIAHSQEILVSFFMSFFIYKIKIQATKTNNVLVRHNYYGSRCIDQVDSGCGGSGCFVVQATKRGVFIIIGACGPQRHAP